MRQIAISLTEEQTPDQQEAAIQDVLNMGYTVVKVIETVAKKPRVGTELNAGSKHELSVRIVVFRKRFLGWF